MKQLVSFSLCLLLCLSRFHQERNLLQVFATSLFLHFRNLSLLLVQVGNFFFEFDLLPAQATQFGLRLLTTWPQQLNRLLPEKGIRSCQHTFHGLKLLRLFQQRSPLALDGDEELVLPPNAN